jgi:hypothetical protein
MEGLSTEAIERAVERRAGDFDKERRLADLLAAPLIHLRSADFRE